MLVAVVAALVGGGIFFAVVTAIASLAALREWHRLVDAQGRMTREMYVTGVSVCAAIALTVWSGVSLWAIAAIVAGMAAAAISTALRGSRKIFWHGFGALYIGLTAIGMVGLRDDALRGGWIVAGIFIAIWMNDSGALFFGKLLGGPKLVPVLSPNKTWAGLVGGIVSAMVSEALFVGWLGGNPWRATLFGFFLALLGHCGDLFESWVKRRFKAKNTGGLIPGHGGMLDRIDSLLFAVPLAAALVLFAGFDPLFGYGS